MIFPGLALGPVSSTLPSRKSSGRVELSEAQKKGGVKGIFGVRGLKECMELDSRAGGESCLVTAISVFET